MNEDGEKPSCFPDWATCTKCGRDVRGKHNEEGEKPSCPKCGSGCVKTIEDGTVVACGDCEWVNRGLFTRTVVRAFPKVSRNEPCPCGSTKKYKKCCIGKNKGEYE